MYVKWIQQPCKEQQTLTSLDMSILLAVAKVVIKTDSVHVNEYCQGVFVEKQTTLLVTKS